jgi:hypothetical protein
MEWTRKIYGQSFPGTVWKVSADPRQACLGVEIRQMDRRQVRFYGLWLDKASPSIREIEHVEAWWCGMEGVADGMLYIHGYAEPGLPVTKGLHAYGVRDGGMRWQLADCYPRDVQGGGIKVQRQGEIQWLDFHRGTEIREPATGASLGDEVCRFPALVSAEAPAFTHWEQLLSRYFDTVRGAQLHHLKVDARDIICHYEKAETGWDLRLSVWEGERLLDDYDLQRHASGYRLDPFFQYRGWLIATRELDALLLCRLD